MMAMSLSDIDAYGKACGIDVTGLADKEDKVDYIERRRGRTAEVSVLGMTLTVPVKRLHDKRVSDLLRNGRVPSEEAATQAMVLLLGEDQYMALVEHCTDEDGTVDVEAIGSVYGKLFFDPELKNF